MTSPIRIPKTLLDQILAHARRAAPLECCGLLIGRGPVGHKLACAISRAVTRLIEATNVEPASPATRYLIDPSEFHQADKTTWNTDEEILGFYHSHPTGDASPSPFDAAQAALWPGYCYLILALSPSGELAEMRCWVWEEAEGRFEEVEIESVCS
jgi:proteasome lid subunit RPN8/RPN11